MYFLDWNRSPSLPAHIPVLDVRINWGLTRFSGLRHYSRHHYSLDTSTLLQFHSRPVTLRRAQTWFFFTETTANGYKTVVDHFNPRGNIWVALHLENDDIQFLRPVASKTIPAAAKAMGPYNQPRKQILTVGTVTRTKPCSFWHSTVIHEHRSSTTVARYSRLVMVALFLRLVALWTHAVANAKVLTRNTRGFLLFQNSESRIASVA